MDKLETRKLPGSLPFTHREQEFTLDLKLEVLVSSLLFSSVSSEVRASVTRENKEEREERERRERGEREREKKREREERERREREDLDALAPVGFEAFAFY